MFGLFLVSRMHEEWLKLRDNDAAVRIGQAITGKTISAAAAIMIVVFSSFVICDRGFLMSTQRRSLAQRAFRFTRTGPAPGTAPPVHGRVMTAGLATAALSLAADLAAHPARGAGHGPVPDPGLPAAWHPRPLRRPGGHPHAHAPGHRRRHLHRADQDRAARRGTRVTDYSPPVRRPPRHPLRRAADPGTTARSGERSLWSERAVVHVTGQAGRPGRRGVPRDPDVRAVAGAGSR